MQNKIRSAFPVCDEKNCLTSFTDAKADIHDPKDGKCYILDRAANLENPSHFEVLNANLKEIHFLCIDYCIFVTNEHKKCDFVLFDDKTFCFVEIKDTPKRNTPHKDKVKAIDQLRETIVRFQRVIDFTGFELEAIISWKFRKTYPAARTEMQARSLEFEEQYGVQLLEGNQKIFE